MFISNPILSKTEAIIGDADQGSGLIYNIAEVIQQQKKQRGQNHTKYVKIVFQTMTKQQTNNNKQKENKEIK